MLLTSLAANDVDLPPDDEALLPLTPFSVAVRYDDMSGLENAELDRPAVVMCVEKTLEWAERTLVALE